MNKKADTALVGKKIGGWEVLSMSSRKGARGNSYFNCRCSCGKVLEVRGTALLTGKSSTCKLCSTRENGRKNRKDDSHVAVGTVYKQYKSNAKMRGYVFDLTKEQVKEHMQKSCYYCGVPPSNMVRTFSGRTYKHRAVLYTGIDRIDNTKGYVEGNTVPCCARCNYAKSDMTAEQFVNWISAAYFNLHKGVSQKTVGALADELCTIVIKCFYAQEKVMTSTDEKEIAEASKLAQTTNKKRNDLIRALDAHFGELVNSFSEKTYS